MRALLVVLTLLGFVSPALSQTSTAAGNITMIRTGWFADSFAVVINAPVKNPASCPTPDGYISDKTQPGYDTYLRAALAAYTAKRPVVITVSDKTCGPAGRPTLVGINIL